jgi:flagellar biosynthesis protein FlhF
MHGKQIETIHSEVEDISQEIKLLRGLLEGQLAGLAWNELKRQDPERLEVLRRLLSVGFSPGLARQIVEHMPAGYSTERGMKWARTALQHNLPTVGAGADIVEAGGVYALVGPTGVGKTTTVAKLAARATLKHGAARVALITTDGYRIGAQDQLRIYGKILGVPVYAVTDEADLAQTLADLRSRHLVLIDTVGMSQRDQRVVEQIALLAGQATPVKRLLLLSANAQGQTLDDVVRRYHGKHLAGCVFTKTDEAYALGAGLDVIIRYKLPLYYITNGQRVPEDLHVASALYLVDRVFKTPPETPAYKLKSEEYALYMGAQAQLDFSWREPS